MTETSRTTPTANATTISASTASPVPGQAPAPELVKHFVSKLFGRAQAQVLLDEDGGGQVSIVFDAPAQPARTYHVQLARFREKCPDAADLGEAIVRSAIARLHRGGDEDAVAATQAAPCPELLPEPRPWIGDFSDAASSSGYRRRSASTEERRHVNSCLTHSVEVGLQMRHTTGRESARSFLQGKQVPPSVIRRVLSNAASRRQFRKEAELEAEQELGDENPGGQP